MEPTVQEIEHYEQLVNRQIDQYKETDEMHDLSPIYDYWSGKYFFDRSLAVTGYSNIIDFYAGNFQKSLEESDSGFLVSIGSGDCSIEIEIVKTLVARNVRGFLFICLELSPIFVEKARKRIDQEGLGDIITVAQIDINKWEPRYAFAGVMAHHALHHFLNLEQLFSLIRGNLARRGRFVTCDKIGRNGHMRWPEALVLTRKIWERLPERYRYNNQFQQVDRWFENRDCSTEGFEGIRAQDIMPLLVQMFSFETFFSYGNLIETFTDRGYGPNFDPLNPQDTAFIDFIQELDEQLISAGILKPTSITAVLMNEPVAQPKVYKHWTPEFCVRVPADPAPRYDVQPLLEKMPFGKETIAGALAQHGEAYRLGNKLSFTETGSGPQYFRYGWGTPEDNFTWSITETAAVVLPIPDRPAGDLLLSMDFIPYATQLADVILIDVFINDQKITELRYPNDGNHVLRSEELKIPAAYTAGKDSMHIEFGFPNRRQPQFENGNEIRNLGMALVSLKITHA